MAACARHFPGHGADCRDQSRRRLLRPAGYPSVNQRNCQPPAIPCFCARPLPGGMTGRSAAMGLQALTYMTEVRNKAAMRTHHRLWHNVGETELPGVGSAAGALPVRQTDCRECPEGSIRIRHSSVSSPVSGSAWVVHTSHAVRTALHALSIPVQPPCAFPGQQRHGRPRMPRENSFCALPLAKGHAAVITACPCAADHTHTVMQGGFAYVTHG